MKERIHENGIDYVLSGDVYIPELHVPETDRPIGHYGRMRKEYLKNNRPILYQEYIASSKLFEHLADINEQANERLTVIMKQMQRAESVTEQLKASNPMEWVRQMNSIRSSAEEIILNELVYC